MCRGQESYNWTDQTAAHMMQRYTSGKEIQDEIQDERPARYTQGESTDEEVETEEIEM